jgi:hypothetical protein
MNIKGAANNFTTDRAVTLSYAHLYKRPFITTQMKRNIIILMAWPGNFYIGIRDSGQKTYNLLFPWTHCLASVVLRLSKHLNLLARIQMSVGLHPTGVKILIACNCKQGTDFNYYYFFFFSFHMFFLVLFLLNQWWTPLLRLQVSDCRTFLIMCDVPSIAAFCRESIECLLLLLILLLSFCEDFIT